MTTPPVGQIRKLRDKYSLESTPKQRLKRLRVAIPGGGIRGAGIAALLAATGRFDVFLIERNRVGSGITSTNHGRPHAGVWNWSVNTDEIILRNQQAYALLKELPDVWDTSLAELYCVENTDAVNRFVRFCQEHKIPCIPCDKVESRWIQPDQYAAIFEVCEYAFNPARLAARLAAFAERTGRCRIVFNRALSLTKTHSGFLISLANGKTIEADIVINALGSWVNTLRSDLPLPQFQLEYHLWRLLVFRSDTIGMPPLDRAITVERGPSKQGSMRGPVSAIPHGSYVVMGCDIPSEKLSSPDVTLPDDGWREYGSQSDIMDVTLFEAHAPYFFPLVEAKELQRLYSFPGIYPKIVNNTVSPYLHSQPTPYANETIFAANEVDNYYVVFGGSATTALIDSMDIVDLLMEKYEAKTVDTSELIEIIAKDFLQVPTASGMIWEVKGL